MLTIITSLRAKAVASDWQHHVRLLESALDSMLANTGDLRILVVCHDVPEIEHVRNSKITFLATDAPVPARTHDEMCLDKLIKLSVGTQWALERGTDYVMFTDADDLVRRSITAFIEQNRGAKGWYNRIQYFRGSGRWWLRKHRTPKGFSTSCIIVRADLLEFVEPPFPPSPWLDILTPYPDDLAKYTALKRPINTLATVGHHNYVRFLAQRGHELQELPFAANIIITHYDSTSQLEDAPENIAPIQSPKRSRLRAIAGSAKRRALNLMSLRPPMMLRDYQP
jgi:hypothetical protein